MRRSAMGGLFAAAALVLATSASALTITLSEMSSDNTPAGVLDATLVFTDLGGGSLKLDVTNDTVAGSGYDMNEIGFNLDGVTMLELDSPTIGWTLNGSAANVAVAPGNIKVDGNDLGRYEFHLVDGVAADPDQVTEGETLTFLFTYTGTLAAGILESNAKSKMVIAKFVEGPATNDPDETEEDSAFGASGSGAVVPEPATAWLLGLGLVGLTVVARECA